MKTIILVRHSSAEEIKEGVSDLSRALVKEGIKEAKTAAKGIKEIVQGGSPSLLFISSPANRALETAHVFARKSGYPESKILIKEALYHDTTFESFLSMIREVEEPYDTVIIFGHNPSISDWGTSLGQEFVFDLPKSSIITLEFEKEAWVEIEAHTGRLKHLQYPREKSKKMEEFEKRLSSKLAVHISGWLTGIASQPELKSIEKHAAKIIRNFMKDLNRKRDEKPADQ